MNPTKHNNFVSLLHEAESKKATSERHLARLLGVVNSDVRRWKGGKGSPDIEVLEELAKLLEIDMNTLVKELNKETRADETGEDALSQKKNIATVVPNSGAKRKNRTQGVGQRKQNRYSY